MLSESDADVTCRAGEGALIGCGDVAENMLVPLAEHILLEEILGDVVAVVLIAALLGGSLIVVALCEHDYIAAGAAVDDGRVA